MSVAARFISGSLASWAKIFVTVGTQIALVPIYLSHWPVETYGCWLVIQAIASFVNIFSLAHHNFVGNTILQVPQRDPLHIGAVFSAALPYSLGLGLLELGVLASLVLTDTVTHLFDPDHVLTESLMREASLSLLLLCGTTFLCIFTSGLYSRIASTYGHFPRTAWWGVGIALSSTLGSALLVMSGAGLLMTVTGTSVLNLLLYAVYQFDLWHLSRRHHVALTAPDWSQGIANLLASFQLGLSYLFGLMRQQGLRVMVSSTLGVSQAVTFATMRTASNVAQQAVSTVVEPVFPEFMGFLRDRRQAAVVGTLAFVWLAVVFMMGPMLVLLQAIAPWLFELWTRGKVPFDPMVFGLFSLNMLLFGLARPADSIVFGNNLLKVQLVTAAVLAAMTVLGIFLLDGWLGLKGVALVLLLTELVSAATLLYTASRWLQEQSMQWPKTLFMFALSEVVLCAAGIFMIALNPHWQIETIALVFAGTAWLLGKFLAHLPEQQKSWLRQRLGRYIPLLGRT